MARRMSGPHGASEPVSSSRGQTERPRRKLAAESDTAFARRGERKKHRRMKLAAPLQLAPDPSSARPVKKTSPIQTVGR